MRIRPRIHTVTVPDTLKEAHEIDDYINGVVDKIVHGRLPGVQKSHSASVGAITRISKKEYQIHYGSMDDLPPTDANRGSQS